MTKHNPVAVPDTQHRNATLNATNKCPLTIQGLDLTGLDEAIGMLEASDARAQLIGKPLTLSLDKVIEDPDQPRKQFDPETLQALADSIAIHGIKSPISVRSADNQGNYRINFGARRRRAAISVGLTEIPAFIDDDHDQYAQVVENIQGDGFTPMEIARFLAQEIEKGQKATGIAQRLGQSKHWFSKYHSLNDLPEYIQQRSDAGDITDYNTLYQIGSAAKKEPARVAQFIEAFQGQITRSDVQAFMTLAVSSDNPSAYDQSQTKARRPEPATKPKSDSGRVKISIDKVPVEASKLEQKTADRVVDDSAQGSKTSGGDESRPATDGYPVNSPMLKIRIKGREGMLRLDLTGKKGMGFVAYEGKTLPDRIAMVDVEVIELVDRSDAKALE